MTTSPTLLITRNLIMTLSQRNHQKMLLEHNQALSLYDNDTVKANLQHFYDSAEILDRALAVVLNSMLLQNRLYFSLTKKTLLELIKNDVNLTKKISLQSKHFTAFRHEYLTTISECLREPDTGKAGVYKLTHLELIELFKLEKGYSDDNISSLFEAQAIASANFIAASPGNDLVDFEKIKEPDARLQEAEVFEDYDDEEAVELIIPPAKKKSSWHKANLNASPSKG